MPNWLKYSIVVILLIVFVSHPDYLFTLLDKLMAFLREMMK